MSDPVNPDDLVRDEHLPDAVRDAVLEGRRLVQEAIKATGFTAGQATAQGAIAGPGSIDPSTLPTFAEDPLADEDGAPEPDQAPAKPEMDFPTASLHQYFTFDHLRPPLRGVSEQFSVLADFIVDNVPGGPERTTALRKLLEAKDCAVRATVPSKVGGAR